MMMMMMMMMMCVCACVYARLPPAGSTGLAGVPTRARPGCPAPKAHPASCRKAAPLDHGMCVCVCV